MQDAIHVIESDMNIEKFRVLYTQLKNYSAVIISLFKDLYRFSPWLMMKILAVSYAGTTLQAFALGSIFFTLKHIDAAFYLHINKTILSLSLNFSVHMMILLSGVFVLFSIAILLIYFADRMIYSLVYLYATQCSRELFNYFPLIVQREKNPALNPSTGIPIAFVPKLKMQNVKLMMSGKILLKTPLTFFNLLYGLIFLLYLEPKLTLLLLAIIVPFIFPFNRLALKVRESEKGKKDAMKSQRQAISTIARTFSRCPVYFNYGTSKKKEVKSTGLGANAYIRYKRLSALSGSQAIGSIALVVTGMVGMLYFWQFYMGQKGILALLVVYFGALRVVVMSIRGLTTKVVAFAKFYEIVSEFFNDRNRAFKNAEKTSFPKNLCITGPDLTIDDEIKTVKSSIKFVAVAGIFPLFSINRYVLPNMLQDMNEIKRSVITSKISIVDEDPDLELDLDWYSFLSIKDKNNFGELQNRITRCCFFIDNVKIFQNMDQSMAKFVKKELD